MIRQLLSPQHQTEFALTVGFTLVSSFCVTSLSGCDANPQLISAATTGSVTTTALEPGEDWTSFLGPHGNGTSTETGIDPQRWAPHPPLRWSIKLGTSYGGPSIIGNRLLQFDRFGREERLTCFDTHTAKELWQWNSKVEYDDTYGYNNGPRCSPLIDDGLVYTYGVAGQLSCIELTSGREVWSKDIAREYSIVQNFFGVASNPYVYNDLLLVMVGGSPVESLGVPRGRLDLVKPNGTAVVAFDKKTGEERYRLGNDLASYASMTVRTIEDKPTGLAFLRSGLIGFDPASGKQLFEYAWRSDMLESVNAAVPVTAGNQILLSEAYEIGSVLLEIKDGQPKTLRKDEGRWRNLPFRAHWSTPILIDGYLYGCSGRNQGDCDFRCIRLSDGELQWAVRKHERSSVLQIDGYLIVLGELGLLELIRPTPEKLDVVAQVDLSRIDDSSDGDPLLDYPCWSPPIVSHGALYVRGRDRLICFDLIDPLSAARG